MRSHSARSQSLIGTPATPLSMTYWAHTSVTTGNFLMVPVLTFPAMWASPLFHTWQLA